MHLNGQVATVVSVEEKKPASNSTILEHQNKMRWQENMLAKNPSSAWVLLFLFV
jgi:hypothetical protein